MYTTTWCDCNNHRQLHLLTGVCVSSHRALWSLLWLNSALWDTTTATITRCGLTSSGCCSHSLRSSCHFWWCSIAWRQLLEHWERCLRFLYLFLHSDVFFFNGNHLIFSSCHSFFKWDFFFFLMTVVSNISICSSVSVKTAHHSKINFNPSDFFVNKQWQGKTGLLGVWELRVNLHNCFQCQTLAFWFWLHRTSELGWRASWERSGVLKLFKYVFHVCLWDKEVAQNQTI